MIDVGQDRYCYWGYWNAEDYFLEFVSVFYVNLAKM